MTPTPVLPSLPEPALRAALRLFIGAAYPVDISIDPRGHKWSEAYLDQALTTALGAIESLSRAPAEPVAWIQHWPGLPDRVFDMTVIDPRKTTWSSGITYTLLYAHTTESAGPAAADYSEQLTKAKSLLTDWVNSFVDCIEGGEADPMVLATREFIALGESHEG